MSNFLGISNVVNATPIINEKDGLTDGFVIDYFEMRNGRRINKRVTKYVREYDYNSVNNDGNYHGFGNKTVYVHSNGKKKVAKKRNIITDKNVLSKIKIR